MLRRRRDIASDPDNAAEASQILQRRGSLSRAASHTNTIFYILCFIVDLLNCFLQLRHIPDPFYLQLRLPDPYLLKQFWLNVLASFNLSLQLLLQALASALDSRLLQLLLQALASALDTYLT